MKRSPQAGTAEIILSPPTRYEQLAKGVVDALHAMMDELPKLGPKERRSATYIRTHIGIPRKFIVTTAGAVQHTQELGEFHQMDVAAAHDALQLGSAFLPVVSALGHVADELQLLVDTRYANAAAEALKIFAIAKTLVRRKVRSVPGDIGSAMVAAMKRDLGRRGRPRKKKAGAAPASPRKRLRRLRKPRTIGQRLFRRVDR